MAKRKRERLGQPRRYTFKLYPNRTQEEDLFRQARMMAELWNALLHRNEEVYRRTRGQKGVMHREGKQLLTYNDMTVEITTLRRECPEWAALSIGSARRVANALADAFQAYFRRMKELGNPACYEARAAEFRLRKGRNPTRYELAGYPNYRRILCADWLPHRFASGCKLRPHGKERERPNGRSSHDKWHLILKGVNGEIRARGEFPETPLDWSDADLRYYDNSWWLSVGIETDSARAAGCGDITVRLNLIDRLADIDGAEVDQPDFANVVADQLRLNALKSDRDIRWPRRPGQKPCRACREMSLRIARLSAHISRARRELLHEWTTKVVAGATRITIIAPPIKVLTHSARGTEKEWGGAVKTIAALNCHVFSQAPASVIQMLKYKAAEAGIPCAVIDDAKAQIAVGRDLSATVKARRKAQRQIKELCNESV